MKQIFVAGGVIAMLLAPSFVFAEEAVTTSVKPTACEALQAKALKYDVARQEGDPKADDAWATKTANKEESGLSKSVKGMEARVQAEEKKLAAVTKYMNDLQAAGLSYYTTVGTYKENLEAAMKARREQVNNFNTYLSGTRTQLLEKFNEAKVAALNNRQVAVEEAIAKLSVSCVEGNKDAQKQVWDAFVLDVATARVNYRKNMRTAREAFQAEIKSEVKHREDNVRLLMNFVF